MADAYGATLMFDAAHLSGPIAGGAWPDPLAAGAHLMTLSTYKSLGGPTAGLVLTSSPDIAQRLEAIAFPGLTANFDAGKTAALAHTLNDWLAHGREHAAAMCATATALADALADRGVAVHPAGGLATESHAFALDVTDLGGGAAVASRLRDANLLTSAIGLPRGLDAGVRIGTNELVRWGAATDDMDVVEGSMAPIEDYSPRHAAKPSCGVAWCRDPNCGRRGARQRPWDRRRLRQLEATTLSA